MIEAWEIIPGWEGRYEVSSLGRVRSVTRVIRLRNGSTRIAEGVVLKQRVYKEGYFVVTFKDGGKSYMQLPHRLVALAFIPNPQNLRTVNHKDGNKLNNVVENLEWMTHSENLIHASENLLMPHGKDNPETKMTEDQVLACVTTLKHLTATQLADMFSVDKTNIYCIRSGKTWSWLTGIPYSRVSRKKG